MSMHACVRVAMQCLYCNAVMSYYTQAILTVQSSTYTCSGTRGVFPGRHACYAGRFVKLFTVMTHCLVNSYQISYSGVNGPQASPSYFLASSPSLTQALGLRLRTPLHKVMSQTRNVHKNKEQASQLKVEHSVRLEEILSHLTTKFPFCTSFVLQC